MVRLKTANYKTLVAPGPFNAGHLCVIKSAGYDPATERQAICTLLDANVEGLLVWPCWGRVNEAFLGPLATRRPVVFVDTHPEKCATPAVVLDYERAGREIAVFLAQTSRRSLVLEDTLNSPTYRELYRGMRAAAAMPDSILPWNVLGRFYETKRMRVEALRAYRKSLEVEWNQPDILLAAQRLERE